MRKIGVTGGAGFIGTNLIQNLVSRGFEVVVVDDLSTGLESNLKGMEVQLHKISIENISNLRSALRGAECIFHLAARGSVPRSIKDPRGTIEVNVMGTFNILEIVRESGAKLIYSSSSSVYGSNLELPKQEKTWTSPISPYAASKLAGEALVQSYVGAYGINAASFRFFNIFGPFQRPDHHYAAVIPKWIWAAMKGLPLTLYGRGTQTRDFTFVGDVVSVLTAALDADIRHGDPVNLAFGNRISLINLVDELRIYFPDIKTIHSPLRDGDVLDSQNDPRLLKMIYPNFIEKPFKTSLSETVNWYLKKYFQ